jgi:very-short-patch-repair endonuclease
MPEEVTKGGRDAAIATLAARQHGVLSSQQLRACGLSSSAIADRASASRLHRIHRGVYAVGHAALGNEGRWMAALLACGKGAVLSHRSAAELWRMLRTEPSSGRIGTSDIHVTVTGEGKSRRLIQVHRSSNLSADEVTVRNGIAVTTPARTLWDLRRTVPSTVFDAARRQAEFLRLRIGDRVVTDHTRSELEAMFLAVVRRHHLPQPEVNVRVAGFIVDFLWRAERLIAELDGWQSHRTRTAFEQDRARDNKLRRQGFEAVRFTWRQVKEDPREVAATIRSLLTALW